MKNLTELNLVELNEKELVQISGGGFWTWPIFFYRALKIQEAVNSFRDGWNSVNCECVQKQEIGK